MEKDDYVRFASTLTTLVNSSSEDLECVKELKVLKLEYHRTFDHRDAKYCDPVIGLSNTLIALALRRMTGLRSFW